MAGILLLLLAVFFPADSRAAGEKIQPELSDKLDMYVHNSISNALDGIYPIEKVYRLSENELVAPEPDQSRFGSTADPQEMQKVLTAASEIFDGQEFRFTPETALMPGTELRYYLDETIVALTWQEVIQNTVYSFSEIRIAHPSQFRRMFTGDSFNSGIQNRSSDMAASVNAVVAISGDFYAFRSHGIIVYRGELYRNAGQYIDTCFFDTNRNMHFVRAGELTREEDVRRYLEEKDILFSAAFGPVLVVDGAVSLPGYYPIGEVEDRYARCAIGQYGELHYLLATANTGGYYTNAPTIAELAAVMQAQGCDKAYTLDGGQTATLVMNDVRVNPVEYGSERNISDIIYFATALPNIEGSAEA